MLVSSGPLFVSMNEEILGFNTNDLNKGQVKKL